MDDDLVIDLFAGPGGSPEECWTGLGSEHGNGYRTIRVAGRNVYLHRASWEYHIGPVPDGLVIDHKCRNRACWNPGHLEPVTNEVNILRGESAPAANARKQACPTCGGPYTVQSDGTRRCVPCRQATRSDTKRPGIGRAEDRTHCPAEHPYDDENTYLVTRPDGSIKQRMCRQCGRDRVRARRAAAKEVVPT